MLRKQLPPCQVAVNETPTALDEHLKQLRHEQKSPKRPSLDHLSRHDGALDPIHGDAFEQSTNQAFRVVNLSLGRDQTKGQKIGNQTLQRPRFGVLVSRSARKKTLQIFHITLLTCSALITQLSHSNTVSPMYLCIFFGGGIICGNPSMNSQQHRTNCDLFSPQCHFAAAEQLIACSSLRYSPGCTSRPPN